MIQGFSLASRDLLNDLSDMRERNGVWLLPDGTDPNDRRKGQITPQYNKVRDVLRAEVEASRDIIPRIVIGKNEAEQRGRKPGEEGPRLIRRSEDRARILLHARASIIPHIHADPPHVVEASYPWDRLKGA